MSNTTRYGLCFSVCEDAAVETDAGTVPAKPWSEDAKVARSDGPNRVEFPWERRLILDVKETPRFS